MRTSPEVDATANALRVSIGLLVRRLRQVQAEDELSLSEISVLARLDRGGPTTAAALAKLEQIRPQSMAATLGALETRDLIRRSPDPDDGRRTVVTITDAGVELLRSRRTARSQRLADALSDGFTRSEVARLAAAATLIERLAERI